MDDGTSVPGLFHCLTCQKPAVGIYDPRTNSLGFDYLSWLNHLLSHEHQIHALAKYKVFDNRRDTHSLVVFIREFININSEGLLRPFSEQGLVVEYFYHPSKRFGIITYVDQFPKSSFHELMLECNEGRIGNGHWKEADNLWACPKLNLFKFNDETIWDRLKMETLENIKSTLTYPPPLMNFSPSMEMPMSLPYFPILQQSPITSSISPPIAQFYNVEIEDSSPSPNDWESNSSVSTSSIDIKTEKTHNARLILDSLKWVGREIYENIRRPSNLVTQSNASCITFEKNIDKLKSISCDSELVQNHFIPSITLNENEIELRNQLMDELTGTLRAEYPNVKTHIYGSCYTGLAGPESDIDILVDPNGCLIRKPGTPVNTILSIQRLLETKLDDLTLEPLYKVASVLKARVPIIKVQSHKTKINLDLSFGNYLSIQNSKLIKFYLENFSPFRSLTFFLNYWSRNSRHPFFKNYSLVLLVLTHLSRNKVIPTVRELQELANENERIIINDWNASFCTDIKRISSFSANFTELELICSFFVEYSELDYEKTVICSLTGEFIPRKVFESTLLHPSVKHYSSSWIAQLKLNSAPVVIQDPFELSFNTAATMGETKLDEFKKVCRDMLYILTSRQCTSFMKLIIELPVYFKSDPCFEYEQIGIPINTLQREVNSILDLSLDNDEELKRDPLFRWTFWKENILFGQSSHYYKMLTFKPTKMFQEILEVNLRQMHIYDFSNFKDDLKLVYGQFLLEYTTKVWQPFGIKSSQHKFHGFSSQASNMQQTSCNNLFPTKVSNRPAKLQKLLVDLPPMSQKTQDEVIKTLVGNHLWYSESDGMDNFVRRLSLKTDTVNFSQARQSVKANITRECFLEKSKEKLISELEFLLSTDPLYLETKVTELIKNPEKINLNFMKLTFYMKIIHNLYNNAEEFSGKILLKLDNQDNNIITEFNNLCQEFETCFNDYAMFRLIKLFERESCDDIFYYMEENDYQYSKIAQDL